MHSAQVVLHVGADVGVGRAEGRVARRDGGGREAYEGDVRDDGASGQTCGAGREWKEKKRHETGFVPTRFKPLPPAYRSANQLRFNTEDDNRIHPPEPWCEHVGLPE